MKTALMANTQSRLEAYADKWMSNPKVKKVLHSHDNLVKIVFQEFNHNFGIWTTGGIQVREDEVSAVMERMCDNTSRYRHVQVMERNSA